MNAEEKLLEEIFDSDANKKLWKNKYKISWCSLCKTAVMTCSKCGNSSCNGSSCEDCHEDSVEFSEKVKSSLSDYLDEKELEILSKARKLEEHIITCLREGYLEVDWNYLHKEGKLCLADYFRFKELKDLRDEGIKDYMVHGSKDVVDKLQKEFENK